MLFWLREGGEEENDNVREEWELRQAQCLSNCSIVKRHQDQGNSYQRKRLTGACLQFSLVRYHGGKFVRIFQT